MGGKDPKYSLQGADWSLQGLGDQHGCGSLILTEPLKGEMARRDRRELFWGLFFLEEGDV
jgi:hypothetical protein